MVDAVRIFPAGFRVTDANGTPQSGATLEFYDAGTSNARAVYTDSGLATSAGSTVTCDSGGYPEVSSVKALLYTGTTAYKVIAKDAAGVTLWTHDDILGAVDTSSFLTGAVIATAPVSATASDLTIIAGDQGKLKNVDCSGATIVATLMSAVTAADGFKIGIRHNGTANQVTIRTVSSQTIQAPNYTGEIYTLRSLGEVAWFISNGSGWVLSDYVPPFISRDIPVIRIVDRITAPPVSPTVGERYLVNGTPTGSWSSFSDQDVLEYDGQSGYIQYTPSTDCGWLAYIIDENLTIQFTGSAWQDWNNVTKALNVLHVQDQKASGTGGGTFTAGSYVVRDLNTVVKNTITGASLATNQVTLPAGSYEVIGSAPGVYVRNHKALLYNITDSANEIVGTSEVVDNTTTSASGVRSWINGTIVITTTKVFELRHQCVATYATLGLGYNATFGEAEVYSDIMFRKVA